jgi:hypothetical protein
MRLDLTQVVVKKVNPDGNLVVQMKRAKRKARKRAGNHRRTYDLL